MIMLIYADCEERCFYQNFQSEKDMNKFINQNDIIVLGSKILN